MNKKSVGRIKNIQYNSDTGDMEVTFIVTDSKFKKKLLRDMALAGEIEVDGREISFTGNMKDISDGCL